MTATPEQYTKIFLVDDHPAVLQGLALLLAQEKYEICGEATCLKELRLALQTTTPDIALVDLSLCKESGLDALQDLNARNIPVLIYSMHEDANTLKLAMERGAQGYVTKREASSVLLDALLAIRQGQRFISPRVASTLAEQNALPPENANNSTLSDREKQIIDLLAQGEPNGEIAAALGVSVRTVETYCSRIVNKLSLDGMKGLRKYAIQTLRQSSQNSE